MTDYAKGPYSMYVRSVEVTDFMGGDGPASSNKTAKEYSWNDRTGKWRGIDIISGKSTAATEIEEDDKPSESLGEKWSKLSPTTRIIILVCIGLVVAVLLGLGTFYCWRQRREGAAQARAEAKAYEEERLELERFRQAIANADGHRRGGPDNNFMSDKMTISSRDDTSPPPTGWSRTTDAPVFGAAAGFAVERAASPHTSRDFGEFDKDEYGPRDNIPQSPGLPPNPFATPGSPHPSEHGTFHNDGFKMPREPSPTAVPAGSRAEPVLPTSLVGDPAIAAPQWESGQLGGDFVAAGAGRVRFRNWEQQRLWA